MNPPNIYIRNLSLSFDRIPLLQNINLTLTAGQCTCLLGPSGIGKTTLLRLIANLSWPTMAFSGEIVSDDGNNLSKRISYMAQSDLLLPWLTALDNALLSSHLANRMTPEAINQAKELLFKVGLREAAFDKYPHELSGGMRQRVALVRTLLQNKPIILMDEPFSAVDAITRFQLQTLATQLFANRTVLLITHDPVEALRVGNVIIILSGQPATITTTMQLTSPTPRDPSDPEFVQHQAELYHALLQAQEISS